MKATRENITYVNVKNNHGDRHGNRHSRLLDVPLNRR